MNEYTNHHTNGIVSYRLVTDSCLAVFDSEASLNASLHVLWRVRIIWLSFFLLEASESTGRVYNLTKVLLQHARVSLTRYLLSNVFLQHPGKLDR